MLLPEGADKLLFRLIRGLEAQNLTHSVRADKLSFREWEQVKHRGTAAHMENTGSDQRWGERIFFYLYGEIGLCFSICCFLEILGKHPDYFSLLF